MKQTRIWAGVVVAGVMSSTAWAGTAVLEMGSGKDAHRMDLEYQGDKLRMQSSADSAMIVRDGKAYSVTGNTVIELSAVVGMMGKMAPAPTSGPQGLARFVGMENTGRSETIAGIKGDVFLLSYEDEKGVAKTEEMVLTKDSRVREMRAAMDGMGLAMASAMKVDLTPEQEKLNAAFKNYGTLRYGDMFRVVSVSDAKPAAARFELPAAPTQIPSLGSLLGGGGGAVPEGAAAAAPEGEKSGGITGAIGGLFGKKADRQQSRVEQKIEGEADQATDSVVDKAIDKTLEKLFGD